MADPLNPIVFIPPALLVLAILGILAYNYQAQLQFWASDIKWRYYRWRAMREVLARNNNHPVDGLREEYYSDGDYEQEGREFDENDALGDEDMAALLGAEETLDGDESDGQEEPVDPQGSSTARLRMHHEMVQRMRARAGFAPEPFPGDVQAGAAEEGGDNEDEEEDDEDGAPVAGPSNPARIKKIGKKRAEKLQRKEQMRSYHEFLQMQREERRQQEELFKVHDAIQREERQRKRNAQLEKDKRRKEQERRLQDKNAQAKQRRLEAEKILQERAQRELYEYLQRVRSFQLSALAKRLGRTETQLAHDLVAISKEGYHGERSGRNNSSTASQGNAPRIILASNPTFTSGIGSPVTSTSSTLTSSASSDPSASMLPNTLATSSRPYLVVLYDPTSELYIVLNKSQLSQFSEVIRAKGRVDKKALSLASETIFQPPLKQ